MNEGQENRKANCTETVFSRKVERKAVRHIRAQHESHSVWFGLGMFGLIGWSIAVPTLAGIALGIWLDEEWPSEVSWTLTLLFAGLVLGCFNAWRWIKQEGHNDVPHDRGE